MTFSITVPVYGTEGFLPQCLDSLVAQTDGDFEVIVVDDCSPGAKGGGPSAKEIVAKYDSRFRYVRHEKNLSLFQARQTGLRAARGDFVLPLDSDDGFMPELLARVRAEIAAHPQTDVVVCQMAYDDGKKVRLPSIRYRDEHLSAAEALDRVFASRIQCAICSKAVRRETYLRAMDRLAPPQDFYFNLSEDLCQIVPVLLNAREVSTLSYPGYRYWVGGASLSQTLAKPANLAKAAENTRRAFEALADYARRNGCGTELLPRLEDFLRTTLRWYLGCLRDLPETEWRACASELCSRFDPALVAREAMLLVSESNSYRIGRALVRPLKAFRRSGG